MPPALGRRTPQKTDVRPKRQAVLNRKDTVEIAKGLTSTKAETSPEKKTPNKAPVETSKETSVKCFLMS